MDALLPAGGSAAFLVLSNPDRSPVRGKITVRRGLGPERRVSFSLTAGGSARIALGASPVDALNVSVTADRPTRMLAVAQQNILGESVFAKLSRGPAEPSRHWAGFYDGGQAVLYAVAAQDVQARVDLTGEHGTASSAPFFLMAGEVATIELESLGEPQGGVSLLLEKQLPVRAWIVHRGGSSVKAMKDPRKAAPHHAFTVRVTKEAATRLLLYNPDAREALFSALFLFPDGSSWTLPQDRLAAGTFVEFDVAGLRDEGLADHLGRTLPEGDLIGQVKLLQKGLPERRLLVQAVIDRPGQRGALRMESCPICVSRPRELAFLPSLAVSGYIGENIGLPPVTVYYEDGSSEDATFFSDLSSSDLLLARLGLLHSVDIMGSGSAVITADFHNPFAEIDPLCILIAAVTTGIIIIGEEPPQIQIADLAGVPRDGTKQVQVQVTPSGRVRLRLNRTSGSGAARFANGGTQMTINGTTTVQIRGTTASSSADNIVLEATAGNRRVAESFSVVWVTLKFCNPSTTTCQRTSASLDNRGRSEYQGALGTAMLGSLQSSGVDGPGSWRNGVEIQGIVQPSDYSGLIVINRTKSFKQYLGCVEQFPDAFHIADNSDDAIRDDDPQSNGSGGVVYDLDAPGIGPRMLDSVGTVRRVRHNLVQWATLDRAGAHRVSGDLEWYSRVSIEKTSTGIVLNRDFSNDNKAGIGFRVRSCEVNSP